MKKLFFVFSLITLLLSVTLCAQAATVVDGGKVTNNVTWSIDSDGTLTIVGEGVIPDYAHSTQPWFAYQRYGDIVIRKLVIGEGITRIGNRAFQNCNYIESAEIADSVEFIGEYTFQNCLLLDEIELSSDVLLSNGTFRSAPVDDKFLSYQQTSVYTGSEYHKRLAAIEYTGDYRTDIVQVALSQLGYHEGDSMADYDGSHPTSSGNFSEFARFAGTFGGDWCSEFYNWCARVAGVPTNVLGVGRSALANNWVAGTNSKYYRWNETIYGGGSYEPKPGDILQWAWDLYDHGPNEALSHTSMFNGATVNDDGTVTFHSIDGNISSMVKTKDYELELATGNLVGRDRRLFYIVSPDFDREVTKYTVSFSCEGKSYPDKTVAELGRYGGLPLPEREGYTFLGWYTEETGGELITMYTHVNITGPQTLYARWEADASSSDSVAKQSSEGVTLNGSLAVLPTFQLFDADGNATNYVRLRDVAALLDGTAAQFDVSWNGKVSVAPHTAYTSRNGTEGVSPFAGAQPYETLADSISVNGADRALDGIVLTDAEGGGHTYFKLRDLAAECGFAVDWQQGTGIIINT